MLIALTLNVAELSPVWYHPQVLLVGCNDLVRVSSPHQSSAVEHGCFHSEILILLCLQRADIFLGELLKKPLSCVILFPEEMRPLCYRLDIEEC